MSTPVQTPLGGNPPATDLFGVAVPTNNAEPQHCKVRPASNERQRPPRAKPGASTSGAKTVPTERDTKPAAPQLPRLLTISEVAVRLRICTKTVRRWIDGGDLHAYRIGRQLRVSEEDLSAFMAQTRR